MSLRSAVGCGYARDHPDSEVSLRTAAFSESAKLQRSLELQHMLPHKRRLMSAVKAAEDSGRFNGDTICNMKNIVSASYAARHKKWRSVAHKPADVLEKAQSADSFEDRFSLSLLTPVS